MSLVASVVIPTRNRSKLLTDCLDGLLAQEFPKDQFEVLVVDDNSTDRTKEAVTQKAAVAGKTSITYLQSDVGGPNAARNIGVRAARSELICFLDDDVALPPGWLRAMTSAAESFPEIACFGGRILLRLEGPSPRLCPGERLGETELDLGDEIQETRYAWSANMAVRSSAFDRIGLFDESLPHWGDETEWEVRYKRSGGNVLYIPEAYLWHRRTETDLKRLRLIKSRFRRGVVQATNAAIFGYRISVVGALWNALMGLRHFILKRCWGGLFHFLTSLGSAIYTARRLLTGARGDEYSWLPRSDKGRG